MPNNAIGLTTNTELQTRLRNVQAYTERLVNDLHALDHKCGHSIDNDGSQVTDYAPLATLLGCTNEQAQTVYNLVVATYQAINISAANELTHRVVV